MQVKDFFEFQKSCILNDFLGKRHSFNTYFLLLLCLSQLIKKVNLKIVSVNHQLIPFN